MVRLDFVFTVRYPYVTGSSVVAIKYKDGILMAADMGGQLQPNLYCVSIYSNIASSSIFS